ncbi:hypothetical protein JQC72_04540 [Polycladomyces sp. WAk]|uniref:Uncharacterized protein n=1 Tax=Polycladomyces zharkentensis TaxID=2807616 RepID=A0ABS2WHI6_9BACL|nr:hypothetical protein [Polycladomyces sp. WAk]MBN2908790.1 hypothetical protein [Polycladomyces sp. WAk]
MGPLTKLNRKSKNEILTQEEIKEQEENLLEFEEKMKKIEEVINQLRLTDSRDVESVIVMDANGRLRRKCAMEPNQNSDDGFFC